jgi:alcohol dehydrogenase class IV
MRFTYTASPVRVVFGAEASLQAHEEIRALGTRPFIITTPEQAALGAMHGHLLAGRCAGHFAKAMMHVPVEIADAAAMALAESGADCLMALGGGSTIGLAKILALRTGLPILAVPTTFAGSEMTPIWGLTEAGRKTTGRSAVVKPAIVIYDVNLLRTLPAAAAITSGFNAIAHCCEALYAPDGDPISSLMAEEAIRALAAALPVLARDSDHAEARAGALYGAWLGGTVLGAVGMALHHKLCHTLGGLYAMPHAELHTAMLPHAIAYNAAHAPESMQRIARALGAKDAPTGLYDLAVSLGAEMSLERLGMPEAGINVAAQAALATPYPNPRPLERDGLLELLEAAFRGLRPKTGRNMA